MKSRPIKFNQPKYVIPLIALPFLFLLFYAYKSFAGQEKSPETGVVGEDTSRFNTYFPEPSSEITSAELKDKFEAYKDRFKQGSYSDLQHLGPGDEGGDTSGQGYSTQELKTMDSLKASILNRQNEFATGYAPSPSSVGAPAGSEAPRDSEEELQRAIAELNKYSSGQSATAPTSRRQTQVSYPQDEVEGKMALFRAQMAYLDSLEQQGSSAPPASNPKPAPPKKERPRPLPVKKVGGPDLGTFNTVTPVKTDPYIRAMLDENITATPGSRVRIRLLDDILVKDNLIPKGTYLYGLVSGFQSQRVNITVTSVMLEEEIVPVELFVYDKDALLGLYVPGSSYREFTKDLGSGAVEGIPNTGEGGNEVVTGVVTRMFQSTTTAASSLIRKDKARLKYNTIVYLVPKKDAP